MKGKFKFKLFPILCVLIYLVVVAASCSEDEPEVCLDIEFASGPSIVGRNETFTLCFNYFASRRGKSAIPDSGAIVDLTFSYELPFIWVGGDTMKTVFIEKNTTYQACYRLKIPENPPINLIFKTTFHVYAPEHSCGNSLPKYIRIQDITN